MIFSSADIATILEDKFGEKKSPRCPGPPNAPPRVLLRQKFFIEMLNVLDVHWIQKILMCNLFWARFKAQGAPPLMLMAFGQILLKQEWAMASGSVATRTGMLY